MFSCFSCTSFRSQSVGQRARLPLHRHWERAWVREYVRVRPYNTADKHYIFLALKFKSISNIKYTQKSHAWKPRSRRECEWCKEGAQQLHIAHANTDTKHNNLFVVRLPLSFGFDSVLFHIFRSGEERKKYLISSVRCWRCRWIFTQFTTQFQFQAHGKFKYTTNNNTYNCHDCNCSHCKRPNCNDGGILL